ncbi:MAG: hypothetical protein C0506_05610 [Anaerolinea sp.]|nr:hypothetical protein [Anaerolinea sp.]
MSEQQVSTGFMDRAVGWVRQRLHQRPWQIGGALGAVAVVVLVVVGVWALVGREGSSKPAIPEPPGFAVSPEGDDVPRLAPIKVTFASAPAERSAEKLLEVEPELKGTYVWLTERTVLFQPEFPGMLRGSSYTVSVPARPETGLMEDVKKQFTVTGLLTVQQAIPGDGDTEVPLNAQILVQFSRSVAPLTTLGEQRKEPVVVFDPPLQGTGEWLNTSIYRFVPSNMQPFTTYKLKVAKGLTSAADGVLKEDFAWSFTTISPAVASVSPDNATEFASLRQPVVVTFNQPMEASAAQGITLKDQAGSAIAGSVAWSEGNTVATFTPSVQLVRKAVYTAMIAKGLKGAKGGATLEERTSAFTTVGLPSVASTNPPNGATGAPRYGVNINFSSPMDPATLEDKISISGIPSSELVGRIYADERMVSASAPLKPSAFYTVTLAPGAKDRYGQVMGGYTFSFTTGALPSQVTLALPGYSSSATYSSSVEPVIYFHSTNLANVRFSLYPLTEEEGQRRLHEPYYDRKFVPSQPLMRQWDEPVNAPKDEVYLGSTSISGGGLLPEGYYFLRTTGEWASEVFFAVVDTVIVTKLSNDELLAWVLDHDTGQPLPGVAVKASGPGLGSPQATTDANGLASFKVPAQTLGSNIGDRSYYLVVDGGGRRGFASTRWQQGSQPYQLNLPTEYFAREWVGQVYTDRPIYRPGEKVEYKGVVRADDDAQYSVPTANPPLQFVIMNSRGQEVRREDITTNAFGTFAGTFELPGDATVGDYSISLRLKAAPNEYFGTVTGNSFLVAEFRKPEFQVEVKAGRPSYVNGESIDVRTTATFFFGGAVEGAPVEWSALGNPFSMRVKGYEQYSFSDYDYWKEAVYKQPVRSTGTARTGADGVAAYSVAAVLAEGEGAQQFTLSATVTDQNAQAVASSTTVTVHPAEYYAGIRPTQYVALVGTESGVNLVTADTDGKILPNRAVAVKVYQREWITTKTQTPEGARRYKSEPRDTLLTTLNATTDAKGEATVKLTPSKPGTLRLVAEVTDSKGRVAKSATYLWVSGKEYASWRITNDDTVALVADKDKYEVGETAEVLVPAPFTGAVGLVTVERGKVITRSVQTFPTNSERLQIPITDRSVPNIFVSVVLYRPPTLEDPVPRYKVGYVQLPVSTSTRVLKVDIRPDREQAKPGETVRYDIKVTDSSGKGVRAELSAAVIDKALLALEDERGPDGLKAFWFQRGLAVYTASSMAVSVNRSNDVIAEPPAGGKGGGGLDDDRLRQDFRNTAYWAAQLVTKDDGTASVEVKMPDNLTTWRMQVRAVSGNTQVGEGTNELISTQPLLLRPALPRFLRVGDSAQVRMLVRNATDKESEVKVILKAEGVNVSGDGTKSAKVPAGQSAMLTWPAKVDAEGTAKFTFTATGTGELKDAVTQELPILLDVTPETMATGGIVTDQSGLEAVYLPPYAILKYGSLAVSVQSALVGSMAGELGWLDPQPREGAERVASRLMATIGVRRAEKSAGGNPGKYDGRISSDVAGLLGRQRPDGGWAWCDLYCESDPNVTGWALMALGEAKRDGINVDAGVLSRATEYVRAYVNRVTDVANPADPNQKAFLLAALSSAGGSFFAETPARALYEQYRSKLTSWGKAYLVIALIDAKVAKDDPQVRALLNDLAAATIPSANGNHWEDEYVRGSFMTNTATTALVARALTAAQPEQPLLAQSVRWLVVARGAEKWRTTIDRATGVLALTNYAVQTGELGGDYSFKVSLDDKELIAGLVKPGQAPVSETKTLPLSGMKAGATALVEFARELGKPGRLYYTMNLRYVTPAKEIEALNRGFAISHEYTLLDDPAKPVTAAKLGDTVRVKVTVLAPADRKYVVVDDMLPAGLEPVDTRLKSIDPKLKVQLEAERDAEAKKRAGAGRDGYYAPWFRWYYSPWQHVDVRDDRTVLFAERLGKGVYEYIYYARATTPGDFFVAPAHVEETYFPEVFGRSDSGRFVVEE